MLNKYCRGEYAARMITVMLIILISLGCYAKSEAGEISDISVEQSALESVAPENKSKASHAEPNAEPVVWVLMKQQANTKSALSIKSWVQRGNAVCNELKQVAVSSQKSIRSFLEQREAKIRPFWIVNALRVEADADTIDALRNRPDVAQVLSDRVYAIPPVKKNQSGYSIEAVEWGVERIRAPEVWSEFGSKGDGIVVANIDTGVQFDHPALVHQYRGSLSDNSIDHNYNWFDPLHTCGDPEDGPCDTVGHGTHTMGTMVGDDGDPGENQIGVAPHAKWIAAKGCEDNGCPTESLLAAAEWVLAPTDLNGENPRPDLRPQIVNNSWGGSPGDPFFRAVVQAWVDAGIFPVFSAGNSGPSCGSANSPGDYPESYAVGAYDASGLIANFSSRGPSVFDVIKPNIAAPGVSVRSSVPFNDYASYSGTSMAAPHLAGTVALIWSAAPSIAGDIDNTRELLDSSAVDTDGPSCGGTEQNNNVWGEGRLDAYAAVEASPRGPTGNLSGTVTDPDGTPLPGVRITASSSESNGRSTTTGEDGSYNLRLLIGTYEVSVSLFGYIDQTVSGVSVEEDQTTSLAAEMTLAPTYVVSGQVVDSEAKPLDNITVTLLSTPLAPAVTDESGQFSFPDVPEGEYQITAGDGHCYDQQTQAVIVNSDTTVNLTLAKRLDEFGYSCSLTPFDYIEAQVVLFESGDDKSVSVDLPFDFAFYGQIYDSVRININGYLTFLSDDGKGEYSNKQIPVPGEPNGAIYALWDDLVVLSSLDGSVRTDIVGEAPNRVFVAEWRNVAFYNNREEEPANFEILLYENGQLALQYLTDDNGLQRGASATIGIENEEGAVGLQYSYNQPAAAAGTAIRYEYMPSGFVKGYATDANDGLPVDGAVVRAIVDDTVVRETTSKADGSYQMQIPVGSYQIEVSRKHYASESVSLFMNEDDVITQDFVLQTAKAAVSPGFIQLVQEEGEQRIRKLTIENAGTVPLEWEMEMSGGHRQNIISSASLERNPEADPKAFNTRDLYIREGESGGWAPNTPGDVMTSFAAQGMAFAYGVGFTGKVWLSDVENMENVEFEVDGTPTGRSWPTPWAGYGAGDMAYDGTRGLMCQTAPYDNGHIHCWDPESGELSYTVSGSPWSDMPQVALAYREDDDTFYIGGWDDGTIYHVAGQSHAEPGAVLDQCQPSDREIAGLSWNPSAQVLWMTTNSPDDTIYELTEDCTVLATFAHPTPGGYNGSGLEIDNDGNLWTVGQDTNMAYLIESGVPVTADIPWLSSVPEAGTLAPGQSQTVDVVIDTQGLETGIYLASLAVRSNSGRKDTLRIPVSLVVSGYRQGINAGGHEYRDSLGDIWAADQRYASGAWGYVQRSMDYFTPLPISGTDEPELYQFQRRSPYGYRFDNVANGIYQVELKFAELRSLARIGWRLFDVIIEDELLLPAHDIVYEVGNRAADDYVFFVEVVDNQMDIRLIDGQGHDDPVINALRVTHRPDR